MFYSPDFVASEIYTIADVTQSKNLLSLGVMARADACVSGWSLTADGAKVIGAFDAVALRKLDTLAAAGKATDKLYAVWADKSSAECSELKTFTVTSAMDATLGSFKVYRVLGEDTTWYDVGANGVEIPTLAGMKLGVKFTAATSTYTFGNLVLDADASGDQDLVANGSMFTVVASQKNLNLKVSTNAVEYHFAFNENSEGKAYFGDTWESLLTADKFSESGKNWVLKKSYSVESVNKTFPADIYSSTGCFKGYAFSATATSGYTELNDEVIAQYEADQAAAAQNATTPYSLTNPMKLYAVWGACSATTDDVTVNLADTDKGTYKFTRTFDLGAGQSTPVRTYEVSDASFTIASVTGSVSFTGVSFEVNSGVKYVVDPDAKYASQ